MMDENSLAEVEQALIGHIILDPGIKREYISKLKPEDFSVKILGNLFEFIQKLYLEDLPIDELTVLAKSGMAEYKPVIQNCVKCTTYAVGKKPEYFCDLIIQAGRMRKANRLGAEIAGAEDFDTVNDALDQLNGILVTNRSVKIISLYEAAKAFIERQKKEKPDYLPWGMQELDKGIYAEPGDFIVIGGYPSAGKTLLSIQLALAQAKRYRVGYFSLETGDQKFTDRVMAHMAKVQLSRVKRHELSQNDWKSVLSAVDELKKPNIDFIQASGMTVQDIQSIALSQRYQIIYVDYLQLVISRGKDRYEEVTNISKGLHTLSQSNGITVVALAQFSRPEKKSDGTYVPPKMSSFKESGQIEQDADIAMLLWPDNPNDNRSKRVLKVAKNKEGERMSLSLEFNGATQTMTPIKPSLQTQLWEVNEAGHQNEQQTMDLTVLPASAVKDMPF